MSVSDIHLEFTREHFHRFMVLHLEAVPGFIKMPLEEKAEIYNGIGPDRFPWFARMLITLGSRIFAPSAEEHDVSYEFIIRFWVKFLWKRYGRRWHVAFRFASKRKNGERHEWIADFWAEFDSSNERFYRNCVTTARYEKGIASPLRYFWLKVAKVYRFCLKKWGMTGILDAIETRLKTKEIAELEIMAEVRAESEANRG